MDSGMQHPVFFHVRGHEANASVYRAENAQYKFSEQTVAFSTVCMAQDAIHPGYHDIPGDRSSGFYFRMGPAQHGHNVRHGNGPLRIYGS